MLTNCIRPQTEHDRAKLELHFCVKTLMKAYSSVRDEVTGTMPYSEYPYRKDGGRWIAMGMEYLSGYRERAVSGRSRLSGTCFPVDL